MNGYAGKVLVNFTCQQASNLQRICSSNKRKMIIDIKENCYNLIAVVMQTCKMNRINFYKLFLILTENPEITKEPSVGASDSHFFINRNKQNIYMQIKKYFYLTSIHSVHYPRPNLLADHMLRRLRQIQRLPIKRLCPCHLLKHKDHWHPHARLNVQPFPFNATNVFNSTIFKSDLLLIETSEVYKS